MFGLFQKKNRQKPRIPEQYKLPGFEVCLESGSVHWRGESFKPEPMVLMALLHLMDNRPQWICGRDLGTELTASIWTIDSLKPDPEKFAQRCIAGLRKSIGDERGALVQSRADRRGGESYRFNESAI